MYGTSCVHAMLWPARDALIGRYLGANPEVEVSGPPLQMIGRSFGSDAAAVNLAVLASATLAIDGQPAAGKIYRPWCVQYGGSDGDNGTTCAFTSFEQCMMTARGGGGFCVQNPRYLAYGSGQKSPERPDKQPGQAALIAADQAIIGIKVIGATRGL